MSLWQNTLLLVEAFFFNSVLTGSDFDLLILSLESSVYQSLWKKHLNIKKTLAMLFRMSKSFTSGLSLGK